MKTDKCLKSENGIRDEGLKARSRFKRLRQTVVSKAKVLNLENGWTPVTGLTDDSLEHRKRCCPGFTWHSDRKRVVIKASKRESVLSKDWR